MEDKRFALLIDSDNKADPFFIIKDNAPNEKAVGIKTYEYLESLL